MGQNTLALCFAEGQKPALCRMLRQLDNFLRLIKHFALKGASPPTSTVNLSKHIDFSIRKTRNSFQLPSPFRTKN